MTPPPRHMRRSDAIKQGVWNYAAMLEEVHLMWIYISIWRKKSAEKDIWGRLQYHTTVRESNFTDHYMTEWQTAKHKSLALNSSPLLHSGLWLLIERLGWASVE